MVTQEENCPVRPLSPRTRALVGFAAFGVFWGSWGAALPAVQRRSDATDADLASHSSCSRSARWARCAQPASPLLSLAHASFSVAVVCSRVGDDLMYLGFVAGPAVVGGVAEATTLRISLGGVAILAVLLGVSFLVVRYPTPALGASATAASTPSSQSSRHP
jgi:hypothetical protein